MDGDEVRIDAAVPNTVSGQGLQSRKHHGRVFGAGLIVSNSIHGPEGSTRRTCGRYGRPYLGAGALVDVSGAYSGSTVEVRAEAEARPWSAEDVLRWL